MRGAAAQNPPLSSSDGNISIWDGEQYFVRTLDISLISWKPVDVNLGNPCLIITDEICQQIGIYKFTVDMR